VDFVANAQSPSTEGVALFVDYGNIGIEKRDNL
jgi:hypothetical protein